MANISSALMKLGGSALEKGSKKAIEKVANKAIEEVASKAATKALTQATTKGITRGLTGAGMSSLAPKAGSTLDGILGKSSGLALPNAKVKDINWAFRKYFLGAFRFRLWDEKKLTEGIYKANYDMYIRKSPNGEIVKVKQCTSAMKKALKSKKPNDNAIIKKGTKFTVLEVVKSGDSYWGKNYSGYICLEAGNTTYCKKV